MDDTDEFKPSPRGIEIALERLGAGSSNAVYIGDMAEDILAGKRAGVKTAAVLTGVHRKDKLAREKPDYMLGSVSEVLNIF